MFGKLKRSSLEVLLIEYQLSEIIWCIIMSPGVFLLHNLNTVIQIPKVFVVKMSSHKSMNKSLNVKI